LHSPSIAKDPLKAKPSGLDAGLMPPAPETDRFFMVGCFSLYRELNYLRRPNMRMKMPAVFAAKQSAHQSGIQAR
jgi:hypothetical protein